MATRYHGCDAAEQIHTIAMAETETGFCSTGRTYLVGRIHSVRRYFGNKLVIRVLVRGKRRTKLKQVVWEFSRAEASVVLDKLAKVYKWRAQGVEWNREFIAPGF